MLKIKDKVNLEILKSFGFVKYNHGACYEYSLPNPNKESDNQAKIIIYHTDWDNYKKRQLYLFADEDILGDNVYKLDVVFDLIQAGLVEKVDD